MAHKQAALQAAESYPYQVSMVSRREFREFFGGRGGNPLTVAHIPIEVGAFISAQTNVVRMERVYAEKMLTKHRLTYEHLRIVQMAIDRGACFTSAKANHLTFIYFDTNPRKTCYLLAIKSANYGQEVCFVSLYRMREDQIKAIRRKQKLLSDFPEEGD